MSLRRRQSQSGQALLEYAITFAGILAPMTFMIIFTAQLLWVWHSMVDFTRDGARYAATHCWQGSGENVIAYMRANVPPMIDMDQVRSGQVEITVRYFSRDPDTGGLVDFTCDGGECSVDCIPAAVTVSIANYQFTRFMNTLGLPPVNLPDFRTSMSIEGAGCDPEQSICVP
ncbi:MAG: hypothetical protein ABJF23_07140 [Bryobacteraceae bacterium]